MSTGGYKCVGFTWAGGRTDSALERCQYVLHGFCSAIVNAQLGWGWDTDFNDGTIGSYKTMGGHTSSYPNIAYILKKTYNQHVYRVCMAYNYYKPCGQREQDCVTYPYSTTTHWKFSGGLYCGCMKDGTFVYDATYGYIPGDSGQFLKWMHFSPNNQSLDKPSFAYQNGGYNYSYYAIIKDAVMCIFYKSTEWLNNTKALTTSMLKGYMFGELFKETAHTNDLNTLACIYLNGLNLGGSSQKGEAGNPYNGVEGTGTTNNTPILINSVDNSIQWVYSGATTSNSMILSQIFTASGARLEGYKYSENMWVQIRFDTAPTANYVSAVVSNTGGGRWTPCYVYYYTGDQQTYGVVQGDSFKGYLDTDLIRGVNPNYTKGQLLGENSEFLYLGGGFAIGWDASNTEILF